jgi:hypothetical protein
MVGQGGAGKPRKKRVQGIKEKTNRATSLYAPGEVLDKLAAARIPYGVAFLNGALFVLSQKQGVRTLAAVDREISILDKAIFDFLEKKEKLIQERERLINTAIEKTEKLKQEAL